MTARAQSLATADDPPAVALGQEVDDGAAVSFGPCSSIRTVSTRIVRAAATPVKTLRSTLEGRRAQVGGEVLERVLVLVDPLLEVVALDELADGALAVAGVLDVARAGRRRTPGPGRPAGAMNA